MLKKQKKNSDALILEILSGIEDVKGEKINLLDLRGIDNSFCEYFIICNGTSNTHVTAIVNSINRMVSKSIKEKPYHTEGLNNSEWVLIDFVNVVVHVFQKQYREFYKLEELWGDAKQTKIA
jgi:ribosome-associated protein